MRTLLLGNDFAFDTNGKLVPIEINTNLAMDGLYIEENVFNVGILSDFITSHGFTKLTYIGALLDFDEVLRQLSITLGYTYDFKFVRGSKSIPYVKDSVEHLIIRSAYDTTATVDDEYCRVKTNFLKLIQSESFGTEFAYVDDNGTLISNITDIEDYGNHPNFILKSVLPKYDKNVYPKLYRVTNQEELSVVLQNVNHDYFLMKFHYNPGKLYENHISIIRSFNLLYLPDLESLSIGQYCKFTTKNVDELSTFDPITYEILPNNRQKYITSDQLVGRPKLLDSDQVEMSDGTFKFASDLQVGDLVMSIKIPNPEGVDLDNELTNYHITYDEFVTGSTYVINEIVDKERVDKFVDYAVIKFDDGTEWEDTANSTYLTLKNDEVRFLYLDRLPIFSLSKGDQVILVDTTSTEFTTILKTVEDVIISKIVFSGWEISVEGEHVFLTKTEGQESQSYATIEHNLSCRGSVDNCTGTCLSKLVCSSANVGYCLCQGKA